ncbi:MAG TPA: hypothetical protein VFA69_07485 [Candidatus Nitrosotalea sp.]|nr:hypothetical protein [Candidatus Nitrosotalea sp.]
MKLLHYSIIAIVMIVLVMISSSVFAQTAPVPSDLVGGNVFNMKVKNMGLPGDIIEINGNLVTKDPIKIMLSDPNGTIVISTTTFSDRNGDFTSELKMPNDPIEGTWKIIGISDIYKNEIEFTIHSSTSQTQYCCLQIANQTQTRTNGADPVSYGGFLTKINSPLEQLRSGTNAEDVKCKQDLQLIFKSEDRSPICVKSATANVLIERGWAFAGFTRGGGPANASTIQVRHADMIVVEDTGTTVIGNQTYYFTTLNDTLTIYHGTAAIPFTFHGVDFTLFPSVFSAGPPGSCGDTNFGTEVKFANMTHERLDVHIPGSPCIENYTETAFTNHENSQVGIEDYYGKIRLLVGGDIQPSSALQLSLLVNGQYQNPSEPVGIDVYLNNTTSKPLTLTGSGNWPRNDLTSSMCSNLPFGISILDGYYDEQNMTGAKSLLLYGTAPCPLLPQIKSYTFQPFSTKATQECDTLFSCTGLVDMKKHFDIGDYVDGNNLHQPFKTGMYTIIAGDKWGNVAIQHFTEANAVAYDNSSIAKGN